MSNADIVPFLKFGTIGVINTLLHSSIVLVLHGGLSLPLLPSHVAAFAFVNAVSYLLNARLVFKASPGPAGYARFLAVSLFSLASNLVIAGACELLAYDYRIGLLAVILISPPLTYVLQKVFTFRVPRAGT